MTDMDMTETEPQTRRASELGAIARPHLALALDTSDLTGALELWRRCRASFAIAKVGLELYSAAGPGAVAALREEGAAVFVDLKLHDIPSTVGRAAGRLAAIGASFVTVHLCGGTAMVTAAVEGIAEGAAVELVGPIPAGVLGVTVLTSEPEAPAEVLVARAAMAEGCGCAGLVCAAPDLTVVRRASLLPTVVPGVRRAGAPSNDQARVATPAMAVRAGARVLVIGRTVTASPDPARAAEELAREVARALAESSAPGS